MTGLIADDCYNDQEGLINVVWKPTPRATTILIRFSVSLVGRAGCYDVVGCIFIEPAGAFHDGRRKSLTNGVMQA